jgi:rhodanese-related sulfurtransferase
MTIKEFIQSSDTFLVDVRTPGEFEGGSARGAVNIPLDQIEMQLISFRGKKQIGVFCRSGNRSAQAKYILERMGIPNVINVGSVDDVIAVQ